MKKLLAVLFMAFAVVCSAQSVKPEFQAFSGALLKLKKAEKGFHKFQLTVDVAPWAFQATGEVQAPGGDPDVLITGLFDGDVYAVLAYVPSTAAGSDGQEYQVGFFDIMLYYEEEPTRVRNLKFKLLPPANDDWALGILKDALESGSLLGNVWGGKYEGAITKASADPLDKKKLQALQKKKKHKLSDDDGTISTRKRRVQADEDEEEVKPKKKKKSYDEDEDETPKKKKSKKKKVSSDDDCDAPGMSVKEKRQCKMKLKK
ncbi:MAG: hypothetical protein MJZ26_06740 [Fibrobacter sp.]|nr:hypothetical protein [Fibrobacter sp.]